MPKRLSSLTCVNSNGLWFRLLLRSDRFILPSAANLPSRLRSGGDRSFRQIRFGSGNSFRYRRISKRGSRFVGCVQLSYVRVCLNADLQIIREIIELKLFSRPFQEMVHWTILLLIELVAPERNNFQHIVVPPRYEIFRGASSMDTDPLQKGYKLFCSFFSWRLQLLVHRSLLPFVR